MPTRLRARRKRRDGREELEEQAPLEPGSRGGLAGRFEELQTRAGNGAVSRLVSNLGDRAPMGRPLSKADAGPAGQLPDREPEEEPAHEKGAGMFKEDGAGRSGAAAGSSLTPTGGGLQLVPGDVHITVNDSEVEEETGRSRADTAQSGTITNTFENPDTSPSAKAFGSESFSAGYKNAAFTTEAGVVKVNFTLDIKCPWGTNGGGKTDIPSGTASAVTKDTYKKIVRDLTPVLKEKSWRAPRSTYWSDTICKRHEKFHSTDDKAWAEGAGKQVVVSYLNGKAVNPATAEADVNTHLGNAMKAMNTANFQFYTGGATSYLSYAGEERAFGDGKQPYLNLAAAVKAQGQALEKA